VLPASSSPRYRPIQRLLALPETRLSWRSA
jgi:hypothetical protein